RVRHERGAGLALGQHVADPALLGGADHLEHVVAGNAEGEPHAVGGERDCDRIGHLRRQLAVARHQATSFSNVSPGLTRVNWTASLETARIPSPSATWVNRAAAGSATCEKSLR